MYELLGYKDFMILPTFWYKKLKEWEGYRYKVVYETIKSQADSIEWAMRNKQFNGETAKVMYVSAIITNNINDTLKQVVQQERRERKVEIIDAPIELDDRCKKTKDISQFLED